MFVFYHQILSRMRTQRLKGSLRREEVIEGFLIEVFYKEDEAIPIPIHAAS